MLRASPDHVRSTTLFFAHISLSQWEPTWEQFTGFLILFNIYFNVP
jgi:hypothetical protein